jgi:CheY-like chemotaxis protein
VILLDEGGAAFELLSQYVHQVDVIRVSSVEAIGRLRQDSDPLAVVISSDDFTLIPVVAQLVGNTVPILTFNLAEARPHGQFHGASDYLMKPVAFEALMAALERTSASLRTVLIVDDNRDNMQMLSRMLNSLPEPPHLLKAYSGRECLALLREETPDVILLDFVLPDVDGMAMLDYLRTESRLARIPVLLVSAHRPSDILPVPGVAKLTLFRLTGFSPAHLARNIEALLVAFGSQS